ncbi:MAG: C4-dicarboxylate ABC transporter permease [Spirochaetae bacterium HGW-Spirochaetae-2]|nr:MAG: C4-dicarboxylate ABC transporter permease [Spirochaetae bacterium HGW-Spirochaetae-2]
MIWIIMIGFFTLVAIGLPIAFSMGLSGVVYILSMNIPVSVAAQRFFSNTQSFSFLAVPFFILAGNIMVQSGIAKRIINFANVLVKHLPGGLACVSVVTSMIMAGVSGSSVADAASVGSILIPEMKRKGYPDSFSAAINATSSVVGIIIPPSSTMIVIAWIANLSVAKMFLAGAIPGIIIGLVFLIQTIWISKKNNYPREERATIKEIFIALFDSLWALILPIFLIGAIVFGIATPTEAASLSAIYALLVGVFVYRSLDLKKIFQALLDTAKSTTIVMLVVCSASIFTWILIRENIPTMIANGLLGLNLPTPLLLFLMVFILFVAGMIMDNVPNLFIFIPIYMPIILELGMDPIHFAIVILCALALGLFTPPVGTTLFISCNLAKISIEDTIKDILPFFISGMIIVLSILYIEPLVMWLPRLVFGL